MPAVRGELSVLMQMEV